MNLFNIGLPKWPGLIVSGKPVTELQAMEIIIRTSGLSFSTNDKAFQRDLIEVLTGIKPKKNIISMFDIFEGEGGVIDWNAYNELKERLNAKYSILDLRYLSNSRICSNYIGGPHGWCDWSGKIFTNTYNIGKWPSVENVYNEWVLIAKAFPFLELRCHLLSGETCEIGSHPVVEFGVKNGSVKLIEPQEMGVSAYDDAESNVFDVMYKRNMERGCTIEQFKMALEVTERSVSDKGEDVEESNPLNTK